MNTREIRQYEMLVRVRDFGTAHLERFPESSVAGQAFTTVGHAVKELAEYAIAQMSTTRRTTKARAASRAALLAALDVVSRTARVVEGGETGFQNHFQLPKRRPAQA